MLTSNDDSNMDNFPTGANSGNGYTPDGKPPSSKPVFSPRLIVFLLVVVGIGMAISTMISFIKTTDFTYEYSYPPVDDSTVLEVDDDYDDTWNVEEPAVTDPLMVPPIVEPTGTDPQDEAETWMSNDLTAWWEVNPDGGCVSLASYVDGKYLGLWGYPSGRAFEDPGIQRVIFDYFNTMPAYEEETVDRFQVAVGEDDVILGICDGGATGKFLKTMKGDIGVVYGIEAFSDGSLYLREYQPVADIIDGYEFVPNWGGKAVISTGYGDAGYFRFAYYILDPVTLSTDMVESCYGGPAYDETTGVTNYEEVELACDRTYQP